MAPDSLAFVNLHPQWLRAVVAGALDEDLGAAPGRDVTTQATVPADAVGTAHLAARADGVIAGLVVVREVLDQVAERLGLPRAELRLRADDGDRVTAGQVLADLTGPVRTLLVAERTLLNLVSRASGVATHTRRWADVLAGSGAQVLDTRKTTPGLRALEKYAVRCGGGTNKRLGLYDVAMVKDNHVIAAGSIAAAVEQIRREFPDVAIQVEADTLAQAMEALDAGATFLLLDNMTTPQLTEVVAAVRAREAQTGRVELEATGNLTLDRAAEVAATGVDYLSVGGLTHSSPILDVALDLVATTMHGVTPDDRPAAADAPTPAAPDGPTVDAPEDDLPEQLRIRRAKRERLLAQGRDPYPVGVPITHTIAQVRADHADLEAGQETDDVVGVAGRVVFLRNTGKLCFVTLQDGAGARLQVMLSQAVVGAESLEAFKDDVDLGDHLFAHGRVICSRRGELSVFADEWRIAAKALRPLPVLHKELSEEARVRNRSVDLIVRQGARDAVRVRADVVRSLRENFHRRGYLEVETPMLQTQAGGAAARPFVTHMNAFDIDLYMRIAPELFLKRAVVGGIERVFEINRNFRNEGADWSHSPEFAMLEAYEAYGDYDTMAALTQDLVQTAARDALGTTLVTLPDGTEYELGGEWAAIGMYPSLSEAIGEEITPQTSVADLLRLVEQFDLQVDPARQNHGKLVEELWEHHVGRGLHAPTFVRDFPVDTSPLTRAHRTFEGAVEKWDLYVRGFELATAYSELVDPVVQRERFEAQARLAAAGDDEAMRLDEDFLTAMEHAMPPSGGMGMGIDRLLMTLTGLGIRETILFPLVRPAR